jgi:hypothetical protein
MPAKGSHNISYYVDYMRMQYVRVI